MEYLIHLGYLFVSSALGLTIYYWSSIFKKIGSMSADEFNEDEEKDDEQVDEKETKILNYVGLCIFIILGVFIWSILGVTAGRISSLIVPDNFVKWIIYFVMYFIFLRIPFGVANKMVKQSFDFKVVPEKILFSVVMMVNYILSICCYDLIPSILKWHLDKFMVS